MTRWTAAAAALALASVAVAAAQPVQVFRAGTDTVLLNVTVADKKGRPVIGLHQTDFLIVEDKVPQGISVFASDPQPIALSILLDSSASMERILVLAQEAAIGFVQRLRVEDVAQVIDFSGRGEARIRQTFTSNTPALEKAIREIRIGGSTALYDALQTGFAEFHAIRPRPTDAIRRQAMIVLSDGEDTMSLISSDEVIASAKRSDVMIYAVALRDRSNQRPIGQYSEADYVLRTLAQTTGGKVFVVDEAAQLAGVYVQIADELAHQYVMGYTSRNLRRDGRWRQVDVHLQTPSLTARTRNGYFGPAKGR